MRRYQGNEFNHNINTTKPWSHSGIQSEFTYKNSDSFKQFRPILNCDKSKHLIKKLSPVSLIK